MTSLAWVALATIVPLLILVVTSFVKLSVVLSLLRNAIGAPDAPSGLVVTGLALALTLFVMAPVAIDMARAATATPTVPATPPAPGSLDEAVRALVPAAYRADLDTAERAVEPLRAFLARHASARDRATFVELAGKLAPNSAPRGDELWVIAPAFVTTELREAFAIAVVLFIPFVVVDLVVALGLAALGLQAANPQTVALPLKLMLFVAVDGWRLLVDALLRGYA
jgi:type III secretion protein R